MKKKLLCALLPLVLFVSTSSSALAEKDFHLWGGLGIAKLAGNSNAYLSLGLEFEYRMTPILGLGAFGNYIFTNPGIGLIGLPEVFIHPLGGDWYFNAAPIVLFGSAVNTEWGARLGTRVPLALGAATLIPQVSADFIAGGVNWIFGLGISI